ncbi:MAG: thioredoxin-disulfide reductase [Peptococcaceae bacterium]|jgi:thioredoxin reductase (NADPH)|nr:thioredoxin-disulfide reductase [Peptococcaceae bacterium]MBQ2014278.1 thioredoxin-disulfide reductase [Peptococcaceae bacterium]MBQ2034468.1 thioredoxin-disulfide reductase [Peptococcaceae bacterium]MBQ2119739.1 thioredoxin-disulfide reductase [Peptococcaceae bacterium]MBQ5682491.1 thioredoxin-disulfide reductase [Peptococcaceae bacterium]
MYEVLVIGAGPAGMTAAIYAARAGYKTAILEHGVPGGQAATTDMIENYPGFPEGISGPELMMKFFEQTQTFGVEMIYEQVQSMDVTGDIKKVITDKQTIEAKAVVIASGAKPRTLGVANEGRLRGRGVSYCATCDGFFFRDQPVAVVGGGDTAVEEAMYLTKMCSSVTLIHRRDELRANKLAQSRAFANEKLTIIYDTVVDDIVGEDKVTQLKLRNKKTDETSTLDVNGVFIFVGYLPNASFLPAELEVNEQGYIITDEEMATNVPGVFAVGDVRQKKLRQVTTAVGDGGAVMHGIEEYFRG